MFLSVGIGNSIFFPIFLLHLSILLCSECYNTHRIYTKWNINNILHLSIFQYLHYFFSYLIRFVSYFYNVSFNFCSDHYETPIVYVEYIFNILYMSRFQYLHYFLSYSILQLRYVMVKVQLVGYVTTAKWYRA